MFQFLHNEICVFNNIEKFGFEFAQMAKKILATQFKCPKSENIQTKKKSNIKYMFWIKQKNCLKILRHFLGKIFFLINSDKVYKNGYWVLGLEIKIIYN